MLNAFISQVKTRGLARVNRYRVEIPFPITYGDSSRLTTLFCEVSSLPGLNISTEPHKIFGESREVPYEPLYEPVALTTYLDTDMTIKKTFDDWMTMVFDPTTRTSGYYDNYVRNVSIYIDTISGYTPYAITLYEAYPKTMNAIQLDYNGKEMMRLNVTLQYKYWRRKDQENFVASYDR